MASAALKQLGSGTLVFVPGIMGSALQTTGLGHNGLPRTETIWGEDLTGIFKTLARDPALLGVSTVQVTGVIREVRLGWFRTQTVYGPLLDFCTAPWGLNLKPQVNFLTFPYDWRADLRDIAAQLDQLVQQLAAPVFIVAHSMGGLVTRLMLDRATAGSARVKGVFQIASPVGGSSKAFLTLRRQLAITPMADAFWTFFHRLDPSKQAKLTRAIGSMCSLYQLLPGHATPVLMLGGGTLTSAIDTTAWPTADHPKLAVASAAHKALSSAPSVPIRCVYSASTNTDWLIGLDSNWSVVGTQVTDGDGTVTSASARAQSTDLAPVVGASGTEHTELCSHQQVHDLLRTFLS
jgi:pimeloyl-ACP methyl ester carboxylesterase